MSIHANPDDCYFVCANYLFCKSIAGDNEAICAKIAYKKPVRNVIDLVGIMTQSQPANSESIKVAIRESGLRATPARIATLKLLHEATSPLTHAEVSEKLQSLGVDKATVFRNLNDMAGVGLLRRTELGDRVWRFELVSESDSHSSAHPHFVCVDCGNVSCMDEIKLTAGSVRLSQEFGEITEILLRGHCNNCN